MDHKVLKRETHFNGHAFTVQRLQVQLPDRRERTYDLVVHPGAVVIVPMDGQGNLLFVEQYRLGAEQVLLELPAGVLEKNESPETCALREIREETGMAAGKLEKLGEMFLAPGYCTEHQYIFLASDLSPAPLQADSDEFLQVKKLPVNEALSMAMSGQIQDAKSLAALFLAQKYLQR